MVTNIAFVRELRKSAVPQDNGPRPLRALRPPVPARFSKHYAWNTAPILALTIGNKNLTERFDVPAYRYRLAGDVFAGIGTKK